MSKTTYSSQENVIPSFVNYNSTNETLNIDILNNNNNVIKKNVLHERSDMTIWAKICFGLAGAPYQMLFVSIGLFSTVFLLETIGLPPEKTL